MKAEERPARQRLSMLELEHRHGQEGLDLTDDQIKGIEKVNPDFRERHVESASPGEVPEWTIGAAC